MSDHNRLRIAEHEAAHVVAAMEMGLKVAWVDIDQGYAKGTFYMAAVGLQVEGEESDDGALAMDATISDEGVLRSICVCMIAPSLIASHSATWLGRYSEIEAQYAYCMADEAGIDREEIEARAQEILDEKWEEISDLSHRLVAEGRIEFGVTA